MGVEGKEMVTYDRQEGAETEHSTAEGVTAIPIAELSRASGSHIFVECTVFPFHSGSSETSGFI